MPRNMIRICARSLYWQALRDATVVHPASGAESTNLHLSLVYGQTCKEVSENGPCSFFNPTKTLKARVELECLTDVG